MTQVTDYKDRELNPLNCIKDKVLALQKMECKRGSLFFSEMSLNFVRTQTFQLNWDYVFKYAK